MPASPAYVAFEVQSGSSITRILRAKDADGNVVGVTAGWNARFQIRTKAGQHGTSTAATLILEGNPDNGRCYVDDYEGERCVFIEINATDTQACNPLNKRALTHYIGVELYDEAAPTVNVEAFAEGPFLFTSETAR